MNIKQTLKLNGTAVALLTLLLCGSVTNVSSEEQDRNLESSPETVDLGTAGNFVILAETGVTTTGTTSVTGDMGVSPIGDTAMTGFDLILDLNETFSTSSLVTGKVYASNYADPTPTEMISAIGDMETAFDDAKDRINPNYIEFNAGDLTETTLGPGLYKWGTSVSFTDNVYLYGDGIFILQIAQDLTVATGAKVILSRGASAENIFWQVSGQTTINAGAELHGIVLCKTAIVFGAGSTLNGRALAQTAVTMISTTIVEP